MGAEVADVNQSEHDQEAAWLRADQAVNIVLDLARTRITVADATAIAREAIERYPQIEVIRIVGRETQQGPLDITVER